MKVKLRPGDAGVRAELAAIVHRALARHPSERFPDGADFRQALSPSGR